MNNSEMVKFFGKCLETFEEVEDLRRENEELKELLSKRCRESETAFIRNDMYIIETLVERSNKYEEDESQVVIGKENALNAYDKFVQVGESRYECITLSRAMVAIGGYVVPDETIQEWMSEEYKSYCNADERYYELSGDPWDV